MPLLLTGWLWHITPPACGTDVAVLATEGRCSVPGQRLPPTPRPPDNHWLPLWTWGQIHLVTPSPALSSPSWPNGCVGKTQPGLLRRKERAQALESDAAGSNPSSDPKTHKGVITGKIKRGHRAKLWAPLFYGWGNEAPERARDQPKVKRRAAFWFSPQRAVTGRALYLESGDPSQA